MPRLYLIYSIFPLCVSVESLVTVPVKSYEDIDHKIEEGTKSRTVAATNMNATSRSVLSQPRSQALSSPERKTLVGSGHVPPRF